MSKGKSVPIHTDAVESIKGIGPLLQDIAEQAANKPVNDPLSDIEAIAVIEIPPTEFVDSI